MPMSFAGILQIEHMRIDVNRKTAAPKSGLERCVLCGRTTDIYVGTPVDMRNCYVEGAGQLCPDCWAELYGKLGSL